MATVGVPLLLQVLALVIVIADTLQVDAPDEQGCTLVVLVTVFEQPVAPEKPTTNVDDKPLAGKRTPIKL